MAIKATKRLIIDSDSDTDVEHKGRGIPRFIVLEAEGDSINQIILFPNLKGHFF